MLGFLFNTYSYDSHDNLVFSEERLSKEQPRKCVYPFPCVLCEQFTLTDTLLVLYRRCCLWYVFEANRHSTSKANVGSNIKRKGAIFGKKLEIGVSSTNISNFYCNLYFFPFILRNTTKN